MIDKLSKLPNLKNCKTATQKKTRPYTKIKTRGPNGSTRGMKMGSDGPQIFLVALGTISAIKVT